MRHSPRSGDATRLTAKDARRAAVITMERMRIGAPVQRVVKPPAPFVRVQDLGARYLQDLAPHWKSATQKAHGKCFSSMVYPLLGDKRVAHLTQADIKAWRAALAYAPSTINRTMAVLSGMMRHAEVLGIRPPGDNPCKGLRRKDAAFTAIYLSKSGYQTLGRALRALASEHPVEVACLRFLSFTGCRRAEARVMEWDWVTEDAVNLPDSKTGPRSIWLGDAARDVLMGLERRGRYVFQVDGQALPDHHITAVWDQVRTRMKKPRLRVHDLRHSFAGVGVGHGEDLGTVGGLLGHADKATTAGYAHLAEAPVRAAADRVGELIAVKSKLARAKGRGPSEAGKKPGAPPPYRPTDPWADVRAFMKAGMGISRWCKVKGVDPDELRGRIIQCRKAQGGVL